MKRILFFVIFMTWASLLPEAKACTGITLRTVSNQPITARTIEWATEPLNMMYVVVPRGHKHRSLLPDNSSQGMRFNAKYGYVGICVEDEQFVMEGINEQGLNAGLFYFPQYGKYQTYDASMKDMTISDMQFVSWILASFATIDEVLENLDAVRIVGIDPRASTVHWRITDSSGRQVVLEVIDQKMHVYENPLGVLTNSPSLPWHLTNLNNYVNLQSGSINHREVGKLELHAFGGGSGMHGLPGDMTPPSRFIRAAFFQSTAPVLDDAEQAVLQAFHILNNFDIPIGIQFSDPELAPDMHSATQITIGVNLIDRCLYYRTLYNSTIRCIDMRTINFDQVGYQAEFLEFSTMEPIEYIEVY